MYFVVIKCNDDYYLEKNINATGIWEMPKFVPKKKTHKRCSWIKSEHSNVTLSFVSLIPNLISQFFCLTFEVFSYLK